MCHITYKWGTSHVNRSCRIWMGHVAHDSSLPNTNTLRNTTKRMQAMPNVSRYVWMMHVTYKWVTSHMKWPCRTWLRLAKYEYVTSHIWMGHVTHINGSCYTCDCVLPNTNTLRHTTKRMQAMPNVSHHVWMIHITFEWVTSHMNVSHHIWMCHITYEWVTLHMNKSRHKCNKHGSVYKNVSYHIWMGRVTYEWVTSRIFESCTHGIAHSSIASVFIYFLTSRATHEWICMHLYVTRLIHICDITHSYVWHDSCICVPYMWHDSCIYVTWLIHMCDTTHIWMHSNAFIRHVTHECIWMRWVIYE